MSRFTILIGSQELFHQTIFLKPYSFIIIIPQVSLPSYHPQPSSTQRSKKIFPASFSTSTYLPSYIHFSLSVSVYPQYKTKGRLYFSHKGVQRRKNDMWKHTEGTLGFSFFPLCIMSFAEISLHNRWYDTYMAWMNVNDSRNLKLQSCIASWACIHIAHQVKRQIIKASSVKTGASSAMKLIESTG